MNFFSFSVKAWSVCPQYNARTLVKCNKWYYYYTTECKRLITGTFLVMLSIIIVTLDPLHPNISMHILYTDLYTFLWNWQEEFISQSRASLVGDHFLYSHDLYVWFRGDIVRRNQMLDVDIIDASISITIVHINYNCYSRCMHV